MSEATKAIVGPNVLLMGPAGTGKTYSLGTLCDWAEKNGKKVNVLFTEAGMETLAGYWLDRKLELPKCLAWHYAATKPLSLSSLVSMAEKVGQLSYESLTKTSDSNRAGENNAYWKILKACADFTDDRTGAKLGAVDAWTADTIFVIDSLSELANAAMKMQIGNKPTAAPPDYGVAQNNLINFIRLCTQGSPCTFVLTAHVDRISDEISGTTKIMVKSIGRAPANEIPQLFSDVIYTVREADKFFWDTAAYGVDTKTRSLGYRSKIEPNFAQIMDKWLARGGK